MRDPAADRRELIAALLGPAEPELTCEECFEQLDRYVDLELAGAGAGDVVQGMRSHLAGCPACREDHDSLLDLVAGHARPGSPGDHAR